MELLDKLEYLQDGTLRWGASAYHNCRGKLAGTLSGCGYHYINGQKRSRIVWAMHNGSIPVGYVIDHINGVRNDDRIENLRLTNQQDNIMLGTPDLYSSNTHGFTGVYFIPSRKVGKQYQASVRINGRNKSFGYHATPEIAAQARAYGLAALNIESRRP